MIDNVICLNGKSDVTAAHQPCNIFDMPRRKDMLAAKFLDGSLLSHALICQQAHKHPQGNDIITKVDLEVHSLQAEQFWRPSVWADAMYAYGRPWPVPWIFLAGHVCASCCSPAGLDCISVLFGLVYFCSRLAAGSRAAWIAI